jgi:hypothetical protein
VLIHNSPRNVAQVRSELLAQHTATVAPETIAAHRRETVLKNARQRRKRPRPSLSVLMLRDLRKFFVDRYDKPGRGDAMPEGDDGALDDFLILLNYVSMLGDHRALRTAKARWMPSLGEVTFDAMVAKVVRSPLYLSPDALGERIGLYDAKRTELKIRTIGAVDCNKAQRIERRKGNKLAKRKAKRAAIRAGRPVAASNAKPWIGLGMSRSSWYAKGKPQVLDSGQKLTPNKLTISAGGQVLSKQPTGASPSGDLTRCVPGVESYTAADDLTPCPALITGVDVLVPVLSTTDVLAVVPALDADNDAAVLKAVLDQIKRDSPKGGRLSLSSLIKMSSSNGVKQHRLEALPFEIGRAAA